MGFLSVDSHDIWIFHVSLSIWTFEPRIVIPMSKHITRIQKRGWVVLECSCRAVTLSIPESGPKALNLFGARTVSQHLG